VLCAQATPARASIAAISDATVTNNMMRLMSTILPVVGRGKKDDKPPPRAAIAPQVSGRQDVGESPNPRIFAVAWALLGVADFRECLFHAFG
jgi:hypothetical protein